MTLRHLFQLCTPLFILSAFSSAAETALNDLLRQGLYAEEVSRDPATAAAQYEQILARFQGQQAIAATALFRLAEVRRQQDKKADAIKLYQQLLTDFPTAEAEAKLARQYLTELGGKIPEAGLAVVDEEEREIARLTQLKAASPDLARNDQSMVEAIKKHQTRVVKWLIDSGLVAAETGAVVAAAEAGDLQILNLLLDAGIHSGASTAVFKAAELGYAEIEKALLEKAKDKCVSGGAQALALAVKKGYLGIVRAHLDAGVDPNWQPEQCVIPRNANLRDFEWEGPPLITAIASNRMEIVELLLNAKADVKLRANTTGVTVLHAAAHLKEPAATELTARLIALGADPNALTLPYKMRDSASLLSVRSPLQYAVLRQNWACAKALIRHGANLKQPGLFDLFLDPDYGGFYNYPDGQQQALEFLLTNGADPNVAIEKGDLPLRTIIRQGNVELLKFFLKQGADANVKVAGWKQLREVGHGDPFAATTGKWEEIPGSLLDCVKAKEPKVALEITRLLLDAGAKADGWLGSVLNTIGPLDETGELVRRLLAQRPDFLNLDEVRGLKDWQPASRRIFLDEVLIPALAKEPGPLLFSATTGVRQPLVIPGAVPLPSTPALLLAQLDALLPEYRETQKSEAGQPAPSLRNHYWPALTLVRPAANGGFERQALDLTDDNPLPELRQGDLLELAKAGEPVMNSEKSEVAALKSTLTWHLRKRITFPVTVELDGQTREVKLRGDLLVFDPTKNEAPLLTAGWLARMFLPDLSITKGYSDLKENTLLTVRRQGVPEVRMDLAAAAAQKFELLAGDHLILPDTKSVMAQAANAGREPIRLVVPGFPYGRVYEIHQFSQANSALLNALPPTLIQLLTDAYFPHPERSPYLAETLDESAYLTLIKPDSSLKIPVIPPHPDFAHLRIRRTGADGLETVIEINLTDAIGRCTEATPVAEARQADVALQPGDVVELPLKTDQLDQPWTGFSAAEELFFRKALGGFVTLKTADGIIEQREIVYHQPEWRQTPHGLLPLPPKQGAASTRATLVLGKNERSVTQIERGTERLWLSTAFVRDGDQLLETRLKVPDSVTPRKPYVPPPPGR